MLDKLNIVKQRFDEVSDLIIQPDVITDQKRYIALNKEDSSMFEYEDGLGFEKLRVKMVEYLKSSSIYTNKENIQNKQIFNKIKFIDVI